MSLDRNNNVDDDTDDTDDFEDTEVKLHELQSLKYG